MGKHTDASTTSADLGLFGRDASFATRYADPLGAAAVALLGLAAYFLFPEDLAQLTRIVGAVLFVLALDLIVGYCGVATLGHAAVYGAGAYAAGYACTKGLIDPILLILIGALVGSIAGLASGAVILRTTGLPQLVLSIAVVQLVHEAANKASPITGGSDGLAGISPGPLLGLFAFDLLGRTAYLFALALLLLVFVVLQRIVRSPFGLLCRGLKQDPIRARTMGAPAYPSLLKMYGISGAVAGIGGALTGITTGVVGLDSVSVEWSATALVMLVLGGSGTLYGALLGAVVFMGFQQVVSALNPFHWLTTVGVLLIVVVLFLPQGLQALAELPCRVLRGRKMAP